MLSFAARQLENISRSKRNRLIEELMAYQTWANLFEMYPKVANIFNHCSEELIERLLNNYPDEVPRLSQSFGELFERPITNTLLAYYLYGDKALSKFSVGRDKDNFHNHVGGLCGYLAGDLHCSNTRTMAAAYIDCIKTFWGLKPQRDPWGVDVAVLMRALAPIKNNVSMTPEELRELTRNVFGQKRNLYKEVSDLIKPIIGEQAREPVRDIIVGNHCLIAKHGTRGFPYIGGYAIQVDELFQLLSSIWGNNPERIAMNRVYDIPAINLFVEWVRDVLYWVYNAGYYTPLPTRVLEYKNHMPYAAMPWGPNDTMDSKELSQVAVIASFTVYEKVGDYSTILGYLPCYKPH